MRHRVRAMIGVVSLLAVLSCATSTVAAAYNPIAPRDAGKTVTLDGKRLTIDQLVSIARYGAEVQLTPSARQRSLNAYLLLLEGARENVPIYYFNRGTGAGRQEVIFSGDPLSSENRDLISRNQRAAFGFGTSFGLGPEVNDEEIVRAMMAVRANTMTYEAASPQLTQMLLDFLNHRITPVVYSRGSPGEGDLPQMYQVGAAMIGLGEVYYNGVRMPASQALAQAGLRRLEPFGADDGALASTNAYTMGQAALLVHDAKQMLDWADLLYAMDLIGMNSSVTPISAPVQEARPFKWLNSAAARALDMIEGSYLFDLDELSDTGVPLRIIQDPESLRASSQRNGAARQAWKELKRDLLVQMNSSDHNPVVAVGWSPEDSPELRTPWFMQYYVRGGPNNADCKGKGCEHGYILSNANRGRADGDSHRPAHATILEHVLHGDLAVRSAQSRRTGECGPGGERLQPCRPDGRDPDTRQSRPRPRERDRPERRGSPSRRPHQGGPGSAGGRQHSVPAGGECPERQLLDERPSGPGSEKELRSGANRRLERLPSGRSVAAAGRSAAACAIDAPGVRIPGGEPGLVVLHPRGEPVQAGLQGQAPSEGPRRAGSDGARPEEGEKHAEVPGQAGA
jgi:hypothetical protein